MNSSFPLALLPLSFCSLPRMYRAVEEPENEEEDECGERALHIGGGGLEEVYRGWASLSLCFASLRRVGIE